MKSCFEGVEETSSKNGIIRVIHVHYIESNILCAGIEKAAKRYRERYGAHWLDSFSAKTIQWL
jgi:hypothetical protein